MDKKKGSEQWPLRPCYLEARVIAIAYEMNCQRKTPRPEPEASKASSQENGRTDDTQSL